MVVFKGVLEILNHDEKNKLRLYGEFGQRIVNRLLRQIKNDCGGDYRIILFGIKHLSTRCER